MNKNVIIVVLIVVILAVGGYFIFIKQSLALTSTLTSISVADQPEQTGPATYTDPPQFAPGFLQCSPSELKMPFDGINTYVITVFGVENGKCHYARKVIDQNGVALQSEVDCKVPKELITDDVLGHFFGQDKTPGKEKTLAEQNKIEADYCKKIDQ